jgi:Na+/H+ antiporter NhaD/arsenite permease-like protein
LTDKGINPKLRFIGEAFDLSFIRYAIIAFVPTVLGLFVIWVVLLVQYRGKWNAPSQSDLLDLPEPDRWQIWKGMAILAVVIVLFLFSEEARPLIALGGAGVLLLSRKMASKTMLNFIDWQLLVLFMSLFIINDRLLSTRLFQFDFSPDKPELFLVTAGLSFFISNVPAVMLLLPFSDDGPLLALASTFAGNMLVISSLANIIVIGQAQKMGVRISWSAHFKTGAIVTLLTLLIAAGWLFLV